MPLVVRCKTTLLPGLRSRATAFFNLIRYSNSNECSLECPEVGTVDQGETIEQAIAGLREATRLYLEEFPLAETSPKFVISIEVSYA